MNAHLQSNLSAFCKRGGMTLFCLLVAMLTGLFATGWAGSLFIITGSDDAAIILDPDQSESPPDLSSKIVYVSNSSHGYDISLNEGTNVVIHHEGATLTVQSHKESVSTLLNRMQIFPSDLEMIGVKLSDSGVELNVASELTYYDYVTERASFTTRRVANDQMMEGEERVVQEGADGMRSSVYEIVWSNGEELSRQFVEELNSTAVKEIIEYGTAKAPAETDEEELVAASYSESAETSLAEPGETGGGIASVSENADGSGTLHLKDGTTLNYSGVRTMKATAYTKGHGGVGSRTASGTAVHVGSVAVDRSVIPLGTRMYITSGKLIYGLAVAEDTGVRGNNIDLYYNTYNECIQFGQRNCTVYILN